MRQSRFTETQIIGMIKGGVVARIVLSLILMLLVPLQDATLTVLVQSPLNE